LEDNPRLLWGYVEVALKPHRAAGEARSIETLNRLYQAALRATKQPPGPPLVRAECGIVNEHWPIERLAAAPRAQTKGEPALESTALLVVRRPDGSAVIVDGAKRANKLVAAKAIGPHSVVVIEAPA